MGRAKEGDADGTVVVRGKRGKERGILLGRRMVIGA